MPDVTVWNVFHDAGCEAVNGTPPGEIIFQLSAQYLSEVFGNASDNFLLKIKECTKLIFEDFESGIFFDGLKEGRGIGSEILSASENAGDIQIVMTTGVLYLRYSTEEVFLGNRLLKLSELQSAADEALRRIQN